MKTMILCFACLFLLASCQWESPSDGNTSGLSEAAHFSITSKAIGFTREGLPCVSITVKNDSPRAGYNVACYVHAKSGAIIVDTGFAYFASGATIGPGESASDDAIFFKITSHSQYSMLTYELSWLSR
jgi:hypothetical protein